MSVLPVIFPGDLGFERDVRSGSCVWGGDVETALDTVRKYDPNQPRVPAGDPRGGQWSRSGGGGGNPRIAGNLPNYTPQPVASASDLLARNHHPDITVDNVIDSVPGSREHLEATAMRVASEPDTKTLHVDSTGRYTAERAALHESLLADTFTPEAIAAAKPDYGEQPTLVILGGRAGAGKSWFTSGDMDSPIADPSKYMNLNADHFKEALPEYEGWNAGSLHEESSDLVSRSIDIARSSGLNVVYDATLRSAGTPERMIAEFKAAGYRVEAYFMHTAPQVSAVRAIERFRTNKGDWSGRYVPPEYTLTSLSNESTFDRIAPSLDNWAVYDGNRGGAPYLAAKKS